MGYDEEEFDDFETPKNKPNPFGGGTHYTIINKVTQVYLTS
jgi:hypothetical protein